MNRSTRLLRPAGVLILALWLIVGLAGFAAPNSTGSVHGGFVRDDDAVSDKSRDSGAPSLALGSLAGNPDNLVPWVAFEQRHTSSAQDIFVKSFNSSTDQWVLRGADQNSGSLNFDRSVEAEQPSIDFAGPVVNDLRTVPWVAWYEPVSAFGHKENIFASKFVQSSGQEFWQPAGQDRSGGSLIPSLNIHTDQVAENPALAGGSTQASPTATVPWVVWEENSATTHKRQIFVSRAQAASGSDIIGGFRWVPTGAPSSGPDEPSINVDTTRDGVEPDLIFSGANNTVPWAVWYEEGSGRPARVFAAKAVADASAGILGGFRWDIQPDCAGNETTCALNRNPGHDAIDPKIATGTLVGEPATAFKPWVAWQESDGAHTQIFVSRFNGTAFAPVGGSLNVSESHNAENPDIFFVGHVPFVSFVEEIGNRKVLLVRHLANPDSGRWDLDTPLRGLNVKRHAPAAVPSLSGNGVAPSVAWEEGDRLSGDGRVFEAHRVPTGPAWGTVSPSLIAPVADQQLTLTISCDHVDGWQEIRQIDFTVDHVGGSPGQTLLLRYTAPANPAQPASDGTLALFDPVSNTFGAPVQIGSAATLETSFARVLVGQSSASGNGANAPAVDIAVRVQFKAPSAGLSTESLRIVTRDNSDTGFFTVDQPEELALPLLIR